MKLEPKEKAKEILENVKPHTQYWDCYNDCPLEYDHTAKVAMLLVDEILKSLEYVPDLKVVGNALLDEIDYWRRVKANL